MSPEVDDDTVYRVTDKLGNTLPNGEYDDAEAALDRRAKEMAKHPDGDLVTVEEVTYGIEEDR